MSIGSIRNYTLNISLYFFNNFIFMLDLRDLIIERIQEAANFNTSPSPSPHHSSHPREQELHLNRHILKQFSKAKKKQKERIVRQKELLQSVQFLRFWHSKVLQNFYNVSLTIFSSHDPFYLSLIESGVATAQKLQQLYVLFFERERERLDPSQLLKLVRKGIKQSNPFILMSWVCEWSRCHLSYQLNQAMNGQFDRHENSMKRISQNKSTCAPVQKDKQNVLSFSYNGSKPEETPPPKVVFTNKESVYGFFLDQLIHYYKALPLELDTNFLKSMRKAHGKGKQFERKDNVQRAVDILIEAKNKHTKDQIEEFKTSYFCKYPQRRRLTSADVKRGQSPSKIKKIKKVENNPGFFDRVRSESKQEQEQAKKTNVDRTSFLLCPKTNEISFESSKEIVRQLRKQKQRRQFELPEIAPHKFAIHSKSTMARSKPIRHLFANNSALQVDDKHISQISPKCYDFKPKSIQRESHNNETRLQIIDNPEKMVRKTDGDDLKRNRKLMLQLLRQKNRYAFLQK